MKSYTLKEWKETSYYVYVHIGNTSKEVRYIGMGKNNRKNNSYKLRSIEWNEMYKYENGVKRLVVCKRLTKEEALRLEQSLITFYGFGEKWNFLVNKKNSKKHELLPTHMLEVIINKNKIPQPNKLTNEDIWLIYKNKN